MTMPTANYKYLFIILLVVVVGYFGYQAVNSYLIKRNIEKVEKIQKKDELLQDVVNRIKLSIIDSMQQTLKQSDAATKDRVDYEKQMPVATQKANQKTIQIHEKAINPTTSDTAMRRLLLDLLTSDD